MVTRTKKKKDKSIEGVHLAFRVPQEMYNRILAEQERIAKETGLEPSRSEIGRLLINRGLVNK